MTSLFGFGQQYRYTSPLSLSKIKISFSGALKKWRLIFVRERQAKGVSGIRLYRDVFQLQVQQFFFIR